MGRFQNVMPWPPPITMTGSSVVWCLLSVVVIHSFVVYEVPGSSTAVKPVGNEVIVPVIVSEAALVAELA